VEQAFARRLIRTPEVLDAGRKQERQSQAKAWRSRTVPPGCDSACGSISGIRKADWHSLPPQWPV